MVWIKKIIWKAGRSSGPCGKPLRTVFDLDKKQKEAGRIKKRLEEPEIWKTQEGISLSAALKETEKDIAFWQEMESNINSLKEELALIDELKKESSEEEQQDNLIKWEQAVKETLKQLKSKEQMIFFTGPYDSREALITIKAGAGGVDAQDWAEMLFRMYLKYLEKKGIKARIISKNPGKEAGVREAVIKAEGSYAYGILKGEHGIHRLVRLSPFNTAHSRETSFALVEVIPLVEDKKTNIDERDVRVDTFRSSGPGGQSVNTTSSAVRITHIPSGETAVCQNERSQLRNKEIALEILKARLARAEEEKKRAKVKAIKGERKDVSWGNQIRSYVLHPYTMAKDHRTGFSVPEVDKVLEGDLDILVNNYLEYNRGVK